MGTASYGYVSISKSRRAFGETGRAMTRMHYGVKFVRWESIEKKNVEET